MAAWIPAAALLLGVAERSPPPPQVAVEGTCEDTSALDRRLRAALPESTSALSVTLRVDADADVQRGRLSFVLDGISHERTLWAESCDALYEASALVVEPQVFETTTV